MKALFKAFSTSKSKKTAFSSSNSNVPIDYAYSSCMNESTINTLVDALDVVCSTFDQFSSVPKIVQENRATIEVMKLVQKLTSGSATKEMIENVEDINIIWASIIKTIVNFSSMLSKDDLSRLLSRDPNTGQVVSTSDEPPEPPKVTVHQQRLLGALFATSEQLMTRNKYSIPAIIHDIVSIFLRDDPFVDAVASYPVLVEKRNAILGVRALCAWNQVLFPYSKAFYRRVGSIY